MNQTDFATLRDALKRDEGLRLLAYTDTAGKITIGYGRNLSDAGITQLEANDMLTQDIARHWDDLIRLFPIVLTLDSVRACVLANMAFNMGVPKLAKFVKTWDAIGAGNYNQAAAEMLLSSWATQVGSRATRLAAEMASGELK